MHRQNPEQAAQQAQEWVAQHTQGAKLLTCPVCGQRYLVRGAELGADCPPKRDMGKRWTDEVFCLLCGYSARAEEAAQAYLKSVIGIDGYDALLDGGVFPCYPCPKCGKDAWLIDEDGSGLCLACRFTCPSTQMHACIACGEMYATGMDDDLGFCPRCLGEKKKR